ncbi:MAG: hypothetical protein JO061_01465, partial [Acidobacteriaceae bacterium]|nr:hypothetical protein [Acidobacteriaceae bacterium]
MDPTTEGAESRAQTEEPPLGPCANTENGRLQSAPPGDAMIGKDLLTSAKLAESSRRAIERELLLLVEASSTLLASPASSEVLSTIVGLAQQFVSADAHAVWKKEPGREWRRLSSSGLSDSYART